MTGTIPSSLGKLSALLESQLYTNALDGAIPDELGLLTGRRKNEVLTAKLFERLEGLVDQEELRAFKDGDIPFKKLSK